MMTSEAIATMRAVPVPEQMRHLPVDPVRGIPIPWFTPMVDGKPEFRAAEGRKQAEAVRKNLCWVCGKRMLNRDSVFIIGPMCLVNRNSAEPPSHLACARYSVRACPFLSRPHAKRRAMEGGVDPPGIFIKRNPGCAAIFTPTFDAQGRPGWKPVSEGRGVLFSLGEPAAVEWWAEGRPATRAEVLASVEGGVPLLGEQCRNVRDRQQLAAMLKAAERWYPIGA